MKMLQENQQKKRIKDSIGINTVQNPEEEKERAFNSLQKQEWNFSENLNYEVII